MIVVSLEIIRAIIDSLVRVRSVAIIGRIIITVMDEFVVVAERFFLLGSEIILLEVLVRLKVGLERFVSVDGVVGDKRNYLDFRQRLGLVVVLIDELNIVSRNVKVNSMLDLLGRRGDKLYRRSGRRRRRRAGACLN